MRAFTVAFRALVSFYNELFLLVGLNVIWWITGGIFVGLALALSWSALSLTTPEGQPILLTVNPFWLLPLVAVPAGPAQAALANVARPVARDLHADRSMYFEGFRLYWKQALALAAISMGVLSLLLLNLFFYISRSSPFFQTLALFWALLIVFWLGVSLYLFPVLVGLKEPGVVAALKTAIGVAFANPFYSLLLVAIAGVLSLVCVPLAFLFVLALPAVIALLGEQGLKLVVERVRGPDEGAGPPRD